MKELKIPAKESPHEFLRSLTPEQNEPRWRNFRKTTSNLSLTLLFVPRENILVHTLKNHGTTILSTCTLY